jgi:DNA-binding CsgD family transcriptional regulator
MTVVVAAKPWGVTTLVRLHGACHAKPGWRRLWREFRRRQGDWAVDEYFSGRVAERAVLDGLLRDAAAGHGRLGVVVGPGCIGKTALIRQFLDGTQPRIRWVCADEDEAALPGGLLEQFGLAVEGTGTDPLRAGAALLVTLRQWARNGGAPGVIVVDNAQWGDQLSLRALSYALRRLRDAPLLSLIAVRDDEFGRLPEGLVRLMNDLGTRLEISGLDTTEIKALAERIGIGPVPSRAARRLLEHTGGVPQYVREVLHAVPRESLRTALCAPDVLLPAPKSLEARMLTALAGCAGPARRLVAAAAVLGTRCRLADAAELASLADPLPALQEAASAGLLAEVPAVDGRCCEFPNASIHAAVYECVGVPERAALHRQAARRGSGAQALAHRAAACGGTDAALARDLAAQARGELAAGRPASARDLYLAAARVAERGADRDRLLQAAVGLLIDLGETAGAGALAAGITATALSAARSLLLGRLATAACDPGGARRWLADPRLAATWRSGNRAADRVGSNVVGADAERADGKDDAAVAAGEFALLLVARHQTPEAAAWARRAMAHAWSDVTRAWARVIAAECQARAGWPDEALASLRAELSRAAPDDPGGLLLRAGLGTILFWCDELPAAARHLAAADVADHAARAPGVPGTAAVPGAAPVPDQALRQLMSAGVRRALADYRAGAWDEAADRAERLATLATDLDQDSLLASAHAAAVYPAAARGLWAAARAHAEAATSHVVPGDRDQLLEVVNARTALAFATDDPEAVLAAARPVALDLAGYAGGEPALLGFWPLYAYALARVGRVAEAADALAPFAELAGARGRRSAIAAVARVQGFIHAATRRPAAARHAYQLALANLDDLGMPHEEALTRLDLGRFLRHQGHRRAAQRELYAARAVFARLGAVPFVIRCDAELGFDVPTVPAALAAPAAPSVLAISAAPGVRAGPGAPAWPVPLTARQLAVARAVAAGKSNQQVARDLYITVKTVEYHVSQIFARLGIDARADIAAALPVP